MDKTTQACTRPKVRSDMSSSLLYTLITILALFMILVAILVGFGISWANTAILPSSNKTTLRSVSSTITTKHASTTATANPTTSQITAMTMLTKSPTTTILTQSTTTSTATSTSTSTATPNMATSTASTPTTIRTTVTASTTPSPPSVNSIASEITFDLSHEALLSNDQTLLQESLCIKLNDVSPGAPFYIEVGAYLTNSNTFPIVVYYDIATDCSLIDCTGYFAKLSAIELKNGQVKYSVSPPVDFAKNRVPLSDEEWSAVEVKKSNCEKTFNTKIEATCTVTTGSVEDADVAKMSLQAALCGILADTSEDLPGVPLFMKPTSFSSSINVFLITIYYKLQERCANDVCNTFCSEKLQDIELGKTLKCTVNPPSNIQSNRGPVAAVDFITEREIDECLTNNYEFQGYIRIIRKRSNQRDGLDYIYYILNSFICTLIFDFPTSTPFYFKVGLCENFNCSVTVSCKGTNDFNGCVSELKNKLIATIRRSGSDNLRSIQLHSSSEAPISLKKWSEIKTMRNDCATLHSEMLITIDLYEYNMPRKYNKDDIQKQLCDLRKSWYEYPRPYDMELREITDGEEQFNVQLYYEYDTSHGSTGYTHNEINHALIVTTEDHTLKMADGTDQSYRVQIVSKLKEIQAKDWKQIKSGKKCT